MGAAIRLFHLLSYLAFRLAEGVIRLLSIDTAFGVGSIGGTVAYRILWRRRALALSNLRLAFGREMSEPQLEALNREHFRRLGANLLAGLKASTLDHNKIWERVTANVPNERGDSGWIALVSHMGNWELYSHLGQRFPEYRFGAVYQTLANPFTDHYVREMRGRAGITLFDRRTQLLSCVRFLREGGVVGVLVDQGAGYSGLWSPLFGRLTSSSTLAARLALRTGLPVVPMAINTCGKAQWKMIISPPIYPGTDDPEVLTAEINRQLEQQIRQSPADWLWAHNRWKPLRPHFLFARNARPVFFPPDFDRSTLDPFRILIISPPSPAEVSAALPAVRAIKAGRPDTWLGVLTTPEFSDQWKTSEVTNCILPYQENQSVSSIALTIRNRARFDAAVSFAPDWRTAMAVLLARIPIRVGRRTAANAWLYTQHPIEPARKLSAAEMNLHIARSVGAITHLSNLPLDTEERPDVAAIPR
jgi:lipopolysaccharide heptosyltransferase II